MFVNFNLYHFWHRPQGIDAANAAVKPGEIDYVTRSRIEVIWGRGDGPRGGLKWSFDVQSAYKKLWMTWFYCTMYVHYVLFWYYIIMIYDIFLLKGWRWIC